MLIVDMDISTLGVYVKLVVEEKLRHKQEFLNKRAKTVSNSGQLKGNVNSFFFQNKKIPEPSTTSAPPTRNKGENHGKSEHKSYENIVKGSVEKRACGAHICG